MHPIETPDKTFHDGDGVSELGTILPAWWLNQVQSELLAVLSAAGIQPDKSQPNQLLAALNRLAVVTTGNQEIGGDKTFTGLTTLKKGAIVADSVGDFNANQYLQIGANNVNSYFYNKRSGKYLSMRNDGELRYDGKRLLNTDDLAGMIPSGTVLYFAGQSAPAGWLKANGAAVSRTAYAALFAAIGTTYGAGDGRSTFNLPDLRGEFIRGWDDGRGVDTGRVFGSAQGDAIRNITGQFVSDDYNRSLVNEILGVFTMTKRNSSLSYDAASTVTTGGEYLNAIKFDASRVVPTAAENRPRNIALLACIKI